MLASMNNAITKIVKFPARKEGKLWFFEEREYIDGDFICAVSFNVSGKKKSVYSSGTLPISVNTMIDNVIINPDIESVYVDHGFSDGYSENEIAKIKTKLCLP